MKNPTVLSFRNCEQAISYNKVLFGSRGTEVERASVVRGCISE